VRAAMKELHKSPMSRRVMIVLGDGSDTNMDGAKTQLAKLKAEAEKDGIEIRAAVYVSKLSGDRTVIQYLTNRVVPIATVEGFAAGVKPLFDDLRRN
jgi:hypothetical protein